MRRRLIQIAVGACRPNVFSDSHLGAASSVGDFDASTQTLTEGVGSM
jgi:hypothetical protein